MKNIAKKVGLERYLKLKLAFKVFVKEIDDSEVILGD